MNKYEYHFLFLLNRDGREIIDIQIMKTDIPCNGDNLKAETELRLSGYHRMGDPDAKIVSVIQYTCVPTEIL